MRDDSNSKVQRSLILSSNYLNFLLILLKQSATNFPIWHSARSNLNSDMQPLLSQHVKITWLTFTMLIPNSNSDALAILDVWPSRDLLWWHAVVTWPHFKLSCTNPTNWSHFNLRSLVWNATKNDYTAWLIVWISTRMGQPCNLGNTILCIGIQGHPRPY